MKKIYFLSLSLFLSSLVKAEEANPQTDQLAALIQNSIPLPKAISQELKKEEQKTEVSPNNPNVVSGNLETIHNFKKEEQKTEVSPNNPNVVSGNLETIYNPNVGVGVSSLPSNVMVPVQMPMPNNQSMMFPVVQQPMVVPAVSQQQPVLVPIPVNTKA